MADDVDRSVDREQALLDRQITAARRAIPRGEPGVCDGCDQQMARLVHGLCAYCRDGR